MPDTEQESQSQPAEQPERVEQPEQPTKSERRVVHWFPSDKRANQQGAIQQGNPAVGRQKREPCYESVYFVKNPGGFKINEILYQGRVVTCECVANYLTTMDREWEKAERALFRNYSINQQVAELGGR